MTLYLSYSLRFATVIVVLDFHVNIFASLIQRLALKFSHTCTSSVFEEDEIKKKKEMLHILTIVIREVVYASIHNLK